MKKNSLSISRCRCLHALPPVVFKTDRIPRFGARCWLWLVRRRDLGRSLFAAVFPEFIAREKPGLRGAGCQGRSAGLVRPAAQRGLGPARLDSQALRATVAGKSDELGERRTAADGPGAALKPTPRGKRHCVLQARLAGWLLADQVQPVRRHCRGAKHSAAGMGCIADPLEGKRSAQASADRRKGTMKAREGRDAMAARCHARQRGPAMPGDAKTIQTGTSNHPMRSIWHLSAGFPCQRWRTPAAIEWSLRDHRRAPRRNGWAHGGLDWPPAVVPCAFIGEGALLPLADSAGQALSRFMPSASIHKARLILTFWSMP